MAEDISARKQAEEARARLAAIVESSDDAILGGTPEGLITSWNRGAELLFGYPAEEVVGGHVSILTPPDRSDEPARLLERLRRRESIAHFETRRVRKDGTQLDVSMSISPLIGADGELAGFSTIVRDITELKSNEAERDRLLATERERNARLRQLDRLKDTFVASVSHELRTPLTSIRGYLELVLDGEAGELLPEQTEFLRIVDRNAERLLKLVGDLLDVAQVDAGRLSLDRRACDLAALVAECVERAAPDAAARELDLGLEARQVPLVPADPARVGQVLDNLISNALKFTPAGGSVRLSVAARNGHVRIDVADTGMGIPEAEKAHLFGRFFRSSNATEGAVAGTGLGLWITRAIVDAHGGRISFKSEEGVGTTFSVEFPSGPPDVVVAPGGESAQAAA
jgi:PAS domain S-box-containing protein